MTVLATWPCARIIICSAITCRYPGYPFTALWSKLLLDMLSCATCTMVLSLWWHTDRWRAGVPGRGFFSLRIQDIYTLRKKRVPKQHTYGANAKNSTLFSEGCFFSLIIMLVRKKAPLCIGVLFCKTAPLFAQKGAVLQKKVPNGTFFKKRVLFWHP